MATDHIDFFNAEPHNDLLLQREENEAYCRAVSGKDYLVYFPDAGAVELDVSWSKNRLEVERLEILSGQLKKITLEEGTGSIVLQSPGKHFVFIIQNPTIH
jgi:hypothetical protein